MSAKSTNGGFAAGGSAIVTRSHFLGSAWLVSAYNPSEEATTLTGYALCVNAALQFQPDVAFTIGKPHAFLNHNSYEMTGRASGAFATLPDPIANPHCANQYVAIGAEFKAHRSVPGRPVAPVPLDRLISGTAYFSGHTNVWFGGLNPGTRVNHDHVPAGSTVGFSYRTRALDPQPAAANFALALRPICVKLTNVSFPTLEVDVSAGATADAAVRCPTGRKVVGGGFSFPARNERSGDPRPQRFIDDGWLSAPTSAPTRDEPSGRTVKAWFITGRNQQNAGARYQNTLWAANVGETGDLGLYFDATPHNPSRDAAMVPMTVPPSQGLVAGAVCATIDAKPTSPPGKSEPVVIVRPSLPPAIDMPTVPLTSVPTLTAPPAPSPTATKTQPPTQPPTQQPQPPLVSIQQPANGVQICQNKNVEFAGTARTRPGDEAILGEELTRWELTDWPNGHTAVTTGTSGSFTSEPNAGPGQRVLTFTATDPDTGLTASAKVTVFITNPC